MTEECTNPANSNGDEIFVGYLPTPPGQRRFLRLILPPLVLGFVGAGTLLAWTFRSPGDGRWNLDQPEEYVGVIATQPYAMIRVPDPDAPDGVRTILLVREGKRGAAEIARGLDGRIVRVRGTVLQRDGRQLLEVIEPIEPLAGDVTAASQPASNQPIGQVTVRGEIIDPKCYFGAMKPGEGKTHKECATLCIAGGIPPMFLVRGVDGSKVYYLLANEQGESVTQSVLPFIADPVELSGMVERRGDLLVLRIEPDSIRRL